MQAVHLRETQDIPQNQNNIFLMASNALVELGYTSHSVLECQERWKYIVTSIGRPLNRAQFAMGGDTEEQRQMQAETTGSQSQVSDTSIRYNISVEQLQRIILKSNDKATKKLKIEYDKKLSNISAINSALELKIAELERSVKK